jgi:small ligand-binding sensory domain FIST
MTAIAPKTSLRFATAISHSLSPDEAGEQVARAVLEGLGRASPDLTCVFFSGHYVEKAEALTAAIRRTLQSGVLIGCSGEGIIAGNQEFEEAPAVVLWSAVLPGTSLEPVRMAFDTPDVDNDETPWPKSIGADTLTSPVLLMFADPFTTPVKDTLASLADERPDVRAIGGLAGGGREAGEHRLILNDVVFDQGLVGCVLSGGVNVHTVISQGCRPIGDRFIVTRSEHNVIFELSGEPALEQLQKTFDTLAPHEQRHAHHALHLGLAMDEHRARFERGDFLVRNLIGADRNAGSIAVGDTVQEGQTVQFHLRDAESASEDLNVLLSRARGGLSKPPLGALIFSCCGRGHHMFGCLHHDASSVQGCLAESAVSGFFCQGEIGPVGNQNFLHGYTASIAVFVEPES